MYTNYEFTDSAMMNYMTDNKTYDLAEANRVEIVGGKAYALSKMIRAHCNVPKGFVVPATQFKLMSPNLQIELIKQFSLLESSFVAVRSSSINEDGKHDAWAGQLDTFLNCSEGNFIDYIEKCWASVSSDRAVSYAKQKNTQSTKVAVIVQEMIQSELSGVAFSAHPILHDGSLVVIEAGIGLGEAIVSGQVTPDTYIVDKASGEITEQHVSNQQKALVKGAEGGTVWENTHSGEIQKLTTMQIKDISDLATRLEHLFGLPVDVEWSIFKNKLYVLQCRPITSI